MITTEKRTIMTMTVATDCMLFGHYSLVFRNIVEKAWFLDPFIIFLGLLEKERNGLALKNIEDF